MLNAWLPRPGSTTQYSNLIPGERHPHTVTPLIRFLINHLSAYTALQRPRGIEFRQTNIGAMFQILLPGDELRVQVRVIRRERRASFPRTYYGTIFSRRN
jgi:hypothetical protein